LGYVLFFLLTVIYCYAKPFIAYGQPFSKPFSFKHTYDSTKNILDLLSALEEKTGIKPILTHKQKRNSIRKVKTDPMDTNRIAEVFYLDKANNNYNIKKDIEELRILCRNYEAINETFRELQLKFRSVVDLIFEKLYIKLHLLASGNQKNLLII